MEIVYKKINELKPYENNSRTHDETQIKQWGQQVALVDKYL